MAVRIDRRAVLAAAMTAVAGCAAGGGDGTTSDGTTTGGDDGTTTTDEMENPALGDIEQQGDLELTSSAFADGEGIPDRYAKAGANVNPPLSIGGVPEGTATFALVVDDPDAVEPAGEVWLHWLVWNVSGSRREIPEGWTPEAAVVGQNDFGNRRYDGPAPPDDEHAYRFKCYALDTELSVPESASKADVGDAMTGHVLAATQLVGTYAP